MPKRRDLSEQHAAQKTELFNQSSDYLFFGNSYLKDELMYVNESSIFVSQAAPSFHR
jgi:hypothetical protein